jgi:hypothetical protein
MPRGGGTLGDRIAIEFVEADVEIGFNLVDLATRESTLRNPSLATRALHDADEVLQDIDERLLRLGDRDRASFAPLIAELRREVEQAKSRNACGGS